LGKAARGRRKDGNMKKIVDGKVYNTETAELIANEGVSLHDFYKTSESLYRTTKGAWFLHGESSAGGTYGKTDGRNWSSGEAIIPMTDAEVAGWASKARINSDEQGKIAELLKLPEA